MDDLELKAPAFRLQGAGVLADLHTGTIDYEAVATVVDTAKGAGGKELAELEGIALPLKVEGPLDDPKISLDWEEILGRLLVNTVLDLILEDPGETDDGAGTEEDADPLEELLKKGLKEGLKGIFGKD